VDRYGERRPAARVRATSPGEVPAQIHASESFSRLVAYTSPYLFWAMVGSLTIGILLLQ